MEDKTITIRVARTEDYKQLADICRNDLGYEVLDELVKDKLQLVDSSRECVFVAENINEVIGFVHVEIYNTIYCGSLANILGLAVSKKNQRMGAGRMLMCAAQEWASKKGVIGVRLNSSSKRLEAHDFYRAIGYNLEKDQIRFMKML